MRGDLVEHAQVHTHAEVGVLVFELAIGPLDQTQQAVVDGHLSAVIAQHHARADADSEVIGELVGKGGLKRDADHSRFLGEVPPCPVVVVVQCQAEVAVHAESDRRTVIELVADEQAGAR